MQLTGAGCRHHALMGTHKQGVTQGMTQALQCGTDRRLAHAQGIGGAGQLPGFHNGVEHRKKVEVDAS